MKDMLMSLRTDVKFRLRGIGSGFLEGNREEARFPLALCVSARERRSFESARKKAWILLSHIYNEYFLTRAQKRLGLVSIVQPEFFLGRPDDFYHS